MHFDRVTGGGVAFGLILLIARFVPAVPIQTTIRATGSGAINTTPFTNATFVITAIGDTANRRIKSANIYDIPNDSATISIEGIGVATFTIPTRVFSNVNVPPNPLPAAGFSRDLFDNPRDILDIESAALAGWTMLTDVGPASGTPFPLGQATGLATTLGALNFSSYRDATLTAVIPEPVAGRIGAATFIAFGASRRMRGHFRRAMGWTRPSRCALG